jgi:hypothetical protein
MLIFAIQNFINYSNHLNHFHMILSKLLQNKFKHFIVLLTCALPIVCVAQKNVTNFKNIQTTLSAEFNNPGAQTVFKKMVEDSLGNLHIIKYRHLLAGKTIYISCYDSTFKMLYDKELELGKFDNNKLVYNDVFVLKGQVYLLASTKGENAETCLLKVNSNGKFDPPTKILDAKSCSFSYLESDVQAVQSDDKTKLLIYVAKKNESESHYGIHYSVLNEQGKSLWSGVSDFVLESEGYLLAKRALSVRVRNFMVDNTGRVFGLMEMEKKADDKNDYIHTFHQFKAGKNQQVKINLGLGKDPIVSVLLLEQNPTNQLTFVGNYSEDTKHPWFERSGSEGTMISKGTFISRLNLDAAKDEGELIVKRPFEEKIDKKALQIIDAYKTQEGNIILSFEQKYISRYTGTEQVQIFNSMKSQKSNYTSYICNHIVAVKYDKNKEFVYEHVVPNYFNTQLLYQWAGMSHFLLPQGEDNILIFNKKAKSTSNWERPNPTFETDRSALFVTFNETGVTKPTDLFGAENENFVLMTNMALKSGDKRTYAIAVVRKKFKLVKFDY